MLIRRCLSTCSDTRYLSVYNHAQMYSLISTTKTNYVLGVLTTTDRFIVRHDLTPIFTNLPIIYVAQRYKTSTGRSRTRLDNKFFIPSQISQFLNLISPLAKAAVVNNPSEEKNELELGKIKFQKYIDRASEKTGKNYIFYHYHTGPDWKSHGGARPSELVEYRRSFCRTDRPTLHIQLFYNHDAKRMDSIVLDDNQLKYKRLAAATAVSFTFLIISV